MFNTNGGDVVFNAGYVLVVESWENDGDHYKTKTKHFENLLDAKMFIQLVKKYAFEYGNHYGEIDGLDEPNFTTEEADWLSKYTEDRIVLEDVNERVGDMSYDVLGASEAYVCRILDSYSIFKIPETIVFESVDTGSGE